MTRSFTGLILAAAISTSVGADQLSLLLNPIDRPGKVIETFQPLTDYLTATSGHTITANCENNYLSSWQRLLRADSPDIIVQAAHITSYLSEKGSYVPVATIDGRLSFSLVTASDDLIIDPSELAGSGVATLAAPYLGAILLNQMFPDPIRRPNIKEASDVDTAVKMVLEGKARAAMIPTPILNRYPEVNPIETSEQFPLITVSVSSRLPEQTIAKIRTALLNANKTPRGQTLLQNLKVTNFIAPPTQEMSTLSQLLRGTHGYR